jgi:hypothetical protein
MTDHVEHVLAKAWALLDSPLDGEAEAAFRACRRILHGHGATFAAVLEQLNGATAVADAALAAEVSKLRDENAALRRHAGDVLHRYREPSAIEPMRPRHPRVPREEKIIAIVFGVLASLIALGQWAVMR